MINKSNGWVQRTTDIRGTPSCLLLSGVKEFSGHRNEGLPAVLLGTAHCPESVAERSPLFRQRSVEREGVIVTDREDVCTASSSLSRVPAGPGPPPEQRLLISESVGAHRPLAATQSHPSVEGAAGHHRLTEHQQHGAADTEG